MYKGSLRHRDNERNRESEPKRHRKIGKESGTMRHMETELHEYKDSARIRQTQ
jgi:hypothetical protein